jgi:hypothetical protein
MTYERYLRIIGFRKERLMEYLEKSNVIRSEANLPLYDIQSKLKSIDIKSMKEFMKEKNEDREFKKFRAMQLKSYLMPQSKNSDWRSDKNIVSRRLFVESDILKKWNKLKNNRKLLYELIKARIL